MRPSKRAPERQQPQNFGRISQVRTRQAHAAKNAQAGAPVCSHGPQEGDGQSSRRASFVNYHREAWWRNPRFNISSPRRGTRLPQTAGGILEAVSTPATFPLSQEKSPLSRAREPALADVLTPNGGGVLSGLESPVWEPHTHEATWPQDPWQANAAPPLPTVSGGFARRLSSSSGASRAAARASPTLRFTPCRNRWCEQHGLCVIRGATSGARDGRKLPQLACASTRRRSRASGN